MENQTCHLSGNFLGTLCKDGSIVPLIFAQKELQMIVLHPLDV